MVHRLRTTSSFPRNAFLLLKLRVLDSAWEAKFEFLLDPVSVERIDIVEAKLRDQEEELMKIDALESKLREQQEKLDILEVAETTSTSLAEFTSTLKFGENGKIRGVGHGSNEVVTNCYNGVLHVRRDGVYLIEAAVKCVGCATSDEDDEDDTDDTNEGDDDVDEIDSGDDEDKFVSLLKNGGYIRMDYFSEECCIASAMAITRLSHYDELMVTSTCTLAGTSTLFITRLAD
ncbi:hypothetical protein Pcac1_g23009 [Phytophthora cactorum]|nr:hypothetical protein Pcac1_g23009 [Phytophthora cactorum]